MIQQFDPMTTLIFTLPLDPFDQSIVLDCVQSSDGKHISAPLALMPQPHSSVDVVAIVPVQALSWHQVKLPQGSLPGALMANRHASRLRAILVGLLEDCLLDDPAQLHFALQPQPNVDAPVWVAACNSAWLTAALGLLAQAGYNVTRIVPETSPQALADAIEVSEGVNLPLVAGMTAGAEDGGHMGMLVCPLSAAVAKMLPADCPVFAEPSVAALAERCFERPITLQQRAQRLLKASNTPWSLAQFEFANAQRRQRWAPLTQMVQRFARAPEWRAARWSLVSLVLVNLIGLNVWAMREQAGLRGEEKAVRAILTDTFPKVPVVVDAPVQMQREVAMLQRARGGVADVDMESMLSAFATLAPTGYRPSNIEFSANELHMKGPSMTTADKDRIITGLKLMGLVASVQGDGWQIQYGMGVAQ